MARVLGVARTTLRDAVKRFQETGSYERRPGQGRKKCTSARDDRFLVTNVLRNRFTAAVKARNPLREVRNVHVSERTVRRRLGEKALGAFRPCRVPQLLVGHRRERLRFSREHAEWNMCQ